MFLTADQEKRLLEMKKNGGERNKRKAVNDLGSLWPGAVVPYKINETLNLHINSILEGMQAIESVTCIRFVEHSDLVSQDLGHDSYVHIFKGEGCWSYVGKLNGGEQLLSLGSECYTLGVIIHELLHTLGFHHEHTRTDRDDYIKVNWLGIDESYACNFEKSNTITNYPYDFDSVMHYGRNSFSTEHGDPSIKTLNPLLQYDVGGGNNMTYTDIMMLNDIYGCSDHCPETECGTGFLGPDCECFCFEGSDDEYDNEECVQQPTETLENCRYNLNATNGTINSPNFPFNYNEDVNCLWYIEAEEGKVITLTFHTFSIESSPDCARDFLEVRVADLYQETDKLCGHGIPGDIRTEGNKMLVYFETDSKINSIGFNATYVITDSDSGVTYYPCWMKSCYVNLNEEVVWGDAKEMCQQIGGHLPVIDTADENDFIRTYTAECNVGHGFWIGYMSAGYGEEWNWVGNHTVNFTNWHSGYPYPMGSSALCAEASVYGYWKSEKCSSTKSAVMCELHSEQTSAIWNDWGTWSACSVSCGGGRQTRHRHCTQPGLCSGSLVEEDLCGNQLCPNWYARGQPASMSSALDDTSGASNAVDGNQWPRLGDGSCSITARSLEPWWMVDLGSTYVVYKVIITNRADCCDDYLVGAVVRVGNVVEILKRNTKCGPTINETMLSEYRIDVECTPEALGRFVSVQLEELENAKLQLCEVEVFTTGIQIPNLVCPLHAGAYTDPGSNGIEVTWQEIHVYVPDEYVLSPVTCSYISGTRFPVGKTEVTCYVEEPIFGIFLSCSFFVTVTACVHRLTDSCYQVVEDLHDQTNAEYNCEAFGGDLVSINSVEEHDYVTVLVDSLSVDKSPWIGYTDKDAEGEWIWNDGSSGYVDWDENEPDYQDGEDCAIMKASGKYRDRTCTLEQHSSICEAPARYPTMFCPDIISTFTEEGASERKVSWEVPTVFDYNGRLFDVECDPQPNNVFPLGETSATCVARSSDGGYISCVFPVIVNECKYRLGFSCFIFLSEKQTFVESQKTCQSVGTNLAIITSKEENEFVTSSMIVQLPGVTSAFIGMDDMETEGTWIWVNGENVDPTAMFWKDGEPDNKNNQDCGLLLSEGLWSDNSCTRNLAAICEGVADFPIITCPTGASAFAREGTSTAEVFWDTPSVNDTMDRAFDIVCNPETNSQFPLGKNNVTCVATADDGEMVSCGFVVTVTACDNRLESNCYVFLEGKRTYSASRLACQELGADLAIIDSLEKNEYITSRMTVMLPGVGKAYIGMDDLEVKGIWKWVNGKYIDDTFTNWEAGMPDGSDDHGCGILLDDGQWSDKLCTKELAAICEKSTTYAYMNCPSDTIAYTDASVNGATASWVTPVVIDPDNQEMQIICEPSSGSEFLIGVTSVTCRAFFNQSEEALCSFKVNVVVSDIVFENSGYMFIGSKQSFQDSRYLCQAEYADLVTIETEAERDFIIPFQNKMLGSSALIGLNDIDVKNIWKWVDGSSLKGFEDWASGEPNNMDYHCVTMKTSGQWKDLDCESKNRAICEVDISELRLICPSDIITHICPNTQRADVNYTLPVLIDPQQRQANITCVMSPDNLLNDIGTYNVTCSAIPDNSVLTATCAYQIIVEEDPPPPTMICPPKVTAFAREGTSFAEISWETPSVNDTAERTFSVVCEPKSKSEFPVGTTNVTCLASADDGATANCCFLATVTACEHRLDTSCYVFMETERTYDDSRAACREIGSDLVVINSMDENEFITSKLADELPHSGSIYIGMDDKQVEGDWMWINGVHVSDSFKHWKPGEPDNLNNQDCGLIFSDGQWTDNLCTKERTSICETSTDHAFINCPTEVKVYIDQTVTGTTASWQTPTVTDPNNREMLVLCEPSTGSEFLKGVTEVTCRALYEHSEQATCSFNVEVIVCDISFEASCYKFISSKQVFQDSRDLCLRENADLVTIKTEAERDFVSFHQVDQFGSSALIGLNDINKENVWEWIDGSQLLENEFQDWASGEPNDLSPGEDCVTMKTSGQWKDVSCDVQNRAICKIELSILRLRCSNDVNLPVNKTASGAVISYQDPQLINDQREVTTTCNPRSETEFAIGTSEITCTGIPEGSILEVSCSFLVTVEVADPPTMTCPLRATAFAREGTSYAEIFWEIPVVSDVIGRNFDIVCDHEVNSHFPLGETEVTCVAMADDGETVSCSFPVIVMACDIRFEFSCYVFVKELQTFSNSRAACQEIGTDLLVIESNEENTFITNKMAVEFPGAMFVYIGMDDVEDEEDWIWVNGIHVGEAFTNWKDGEPDNKDNQDCGVILEDGQWSDNFCNRNIESICEIRTTYAFMECPNDIVVYIDQFVTGSTASWDVPTVTGFYNREMQVICEPTSASEFLVGDTEVTCTAMFEQSEEAACSFNVNVVVCDRTFGTSCYKFISSKQSFNKSRDLCKADYADLVSIQTQSERDFISEIQNEVLRSSALIGLNDIEDEGTWRWIDGLILNQDEFQDWASGEPNNVSPGEDCVTMKTSGQWKDTSCDAQNRAMCEIEMSIIQLSCPNDIYLEISQSESGKSIYYNDPVVIDPKQRQAKIICSSPSGSTFDIGVTNVTCSAEPHGSILVAFCRFSVTLEAVDLPAMTCPIGAATFAREGTSSTEIVWDTPTIYDAIGRTFHIVCDPESNSQFPVGETNVTCVATATDNTVTSCSFPAIVTACDIRLQFNCYVFMKEKKEYSESRSGCQHIGADLLVIDSVEENSFITDRIGKELPDVSMIYIGMNDMEVEGKWKWINGNEVKDSFTNWKDGEPDNANEQDCGLILDDGQWSDNYCDRDLMSICEISTMYAFMECPHNFKVEVDPSVTGAAASWNTPIVVDPNNREMQVNCDPSSGSEFLIGETSVKCVATYDQTEQAQCSFNISVDVCNTAFESSCYTFIGSKQIFEDARDRCQEENANLVSIETQAERDYILPLQIEYFGSSALIGLNDIDDEGVWKWSDGSILDQDDFQDWASGEPNNLEPGEHCVTMKTSGEWKDVNCDVKNRVICESEIPKLRLSCPDDVTIPISHNDVDGVVTYNTPVLIDPEHHREAFITCTPASGTVFPLGTTVVTCHGVPEGSILTTTCSFLVTVEVAPMPILVCPSRATAFAREGTSTANVVWDDPDVEDVLNREFDIICNPNATSEFPVGDSNVECIATGDGHVVSCTFLVTVTACDNRLGFNCYVFMNVKRTFSESRLACEEIGADLLVINSMEENEYITSTMEVELPGVMSAFIGMEDIDIEGEWVWINGGHVNNNFTNWKPGEPDNANNQDCGLLLDDGQWSDNLCTRDSAAICEISTSYAYMTCPDNIVVHTDPKVNGATVSWDAPVVTDPNNREMQLSCEPSEGSEFLTGVTMVTCAATYNDSEQATCSFSVDVIACTTAFEDSCYTLINTKQVFQSSRDQCLGEKSDLVSIETEAERDHVVGLQIELLGSSAFIGLTDIDVENSWKWADGTPLAENEFKDWASGEPNNANPGEDCVTMKTSGQWKDVKCDAKNRAICEMDIYPLRLSCPANIDVTIKQGTLEKVINYDPPELLDPEYDRQTTITCSSPSGTAFALGTTDVTCVAVLSQSILTASCSFLVTLVECEMEYLDSCYFYMSTKQTFDQQISTCQEIGGTMADIHSQEENDFLSVTFQSLMGNNKVYAGLRYEIDSGWGWEDGRGIEDYQYWDSSQPKKYVYGESCLSLRSNGLWVDQYCTTKLPTICEIGLQ